MQHGPFCCPRVAMAPPGPLIPAQGDRWDDRFATLLGAFCQWARGRTTRTPLAPHDCAETRTLVVTWVTGTRPGQVAYRHASTSKETTATGGVRYRHAFARVRGLCTVRGLPLARRYMQCAGMASRCGTHYTLSVWENEQVAAQSAPATPATLKPETEQESAPPPLPRASLVRRMSLMILPPWAVAETRKRRKSAAIPPRRADDTAQALSHGEGSHFRKSCGTAAVITPRPIA
jgi:hypothetical protein